MQNDDMIWQVINKDFCSFKVKTVREDMCRNEYNVSGRCNRVSCPLANSNYATVTESNGHLFLCLKTVERAHLPRTMWEKIALPISIDQARDAIEKEMKNAYKNHQIERCKRRAVRLKQMLDRMRRLELKMKERLVPVKKKTERREATREKKAEVAAHLEDVIESELLSRLQQASHVTVEQGTDEEELVKSDSEPEHEVAAAERYLVPDNVAAPADVEDLARNWDRVATQGDHTALRSRKDSPMRLRAEADPVTEYNCKRLAVRAPEAHNSIVRKRPRFFEAKRVSAGNDKAPGTVPIFYEDEGERLHNLQ